VKALLLSICLLIGSNAFADQGAYYSCVHKLETETELGRLFVSRVSGKQPWAVPAHDSAELDETARDAAISFDTIPEARNLAERIFPRDDVATRRIKFIERAKESFLHQLAEKEAIGFLAMRDVQCSRYLSR